MFSSMIQNLLSSSGKASAMQRAVQMNNYVNTLNAQWAPVEKQNTAVENQQAKIQSFENVLKNSTGVKFGDLLTRPVTKVNANIYSAQAETGAEKISTREQIKNIVFRAAKKHGVDEKLVNALIKQESGFNPNARSKVGAMGLMQLMPAKVFIIHLRVPLFINFLVAKLERSTPPKIDETNAVFVMKDVFLSFFL